MNFTIWFFIEWAGTIIALSGSVIMASQKISPVVGWKLWALSHLFHISLFIHTGQLGLLYLQLVGLLIALMGLWQWSYHKEINQKLMKLFSFLSFVGLSVALVLIVDIVTSPEFKKLEWIGVLLSVSAALLLASKHVWLKMTWPLWVISNMILLTFTVSNKQWGIATLQLGFMLVNIYGCYQWMRKTNNLKS